MLKKVIRRFLKTEKVCTITFFSSVFDSSLSPLATHFHIAIISMEASIGKMIQKSNIMIALYEIKE
ncbi:MAG: hypothetical protein ACREHC_07755 [Candidatus Levyibacteriota bacterium]